MWVMSGLMLLTLQNTCLFAGPASEPLATWRQTPSALERRLGKGFIQWLPGEKTLIVYDFEKNAAVEKARLKPELPMWPILDWIRHGRFVYVVQRSDEFPGQVWVSRLDVKDVSAFFQWRIEHSAPVVSASLNHHRRRLLTMDQKGKVSLWRVELDPYENLFEHRQQEAVLLKEHHFEKRPRSPYEPAWSPLGNFYSLPQKGGGIRLFDGQDGVVLGDFHGQRRDGLYRPDDPYTHELVFSQREERMAVLRYSRPGAFTPTHDLVVWDNWGLNAGRIMEVEGAGVLSMDFDRMEDLLALSHRGQLVVWDTQLNVSLQSWDIGVVHEVRCHPWRSWIAVIAEKGGLDLFDMKTGDKLAHFNGADPRGRRLEFSYDGRLLLLLGGTGEGAFLQAWSLPSIP